MSSSSCQRLSRKCSASVSVFAGGQQHRRTGKGLLLRDCPSERHFSIYRNSQSDAWSGDIGKRPFGRHNYFALVLQTRGNTSGSRRWMSSEPFSNITGRRREGYRGHRGPDRRNKVVYVPGGQVFSSATVDEKVEAVEKIFNRKVDRVVRCPSGSTGWRMKNSLSVIQRPKNYTNGTDRPQTDFLFCMIDPKTREMVDIGTHLDIMHPRINAVLPIILTLLSEDPILSEKITGIRTQTTLSGCLAISFVYKAKKDKAKWLRSAEVVRRALRAASDAMEVTILALSRGEKHVLGSGLLFETFELDCGDVDLTPFKNIHKASIRTHRKDRKPSNIVTYERRKKTSFNLEGTNDMKDHVSVHLRQEINSFSQPNAFINQKMLEWSIEAASRKRGHTGNDLLEMYCGNGNFTMALAKTVFDRVLATECGRTEIENAEWAVSANGVKNRIELVRMTSLELCQALSGARAFYRLNNIDVSNFHFRTVLVDPPRAGIDESTASLLRRHNGQLLYISCNPLTLKRDLDAISTQEDHSISIRELVCFDQFPGTAHLELGVDIEMRREK